MKIATFLFQEVDVFSQNCLALSEILIKIKIMVYVTLFVILLTSAVICKQRFLYGNEIVQYLQNRKCYNVGQDHFRKPL